MKATVRLYENDGEKEQGFPIKIILSHTFSKGNTKTRRKTIGYSKLYDWNIDKQVPRSSHPDYEEIYDLLSRIRKEAGRSLFKSLESFDTAFKYLVPSEERTVDFLQYGEKRAKYMEDINREGNARAYRIALRELKKFREPVFFKDLTPEFFHRFKEHKKKEANVSNSTLRAYLYALKAIYTAAVDNGIIADAEPFKRAFKDIPKNRRNEDVSYLEKSEIKKLEQAEFPKKEYNRARDLALLQFYLGGLDFMDLCYLKKSKVRKNSIIIRRHKLGEKGYDFSILLPEKARVLMERYKGDDEIYWFDFPKGEKAYSLFRGATYRYLKRIRKKLNLELTPIDGKLNLKTMRRSFRTIGKHLHIEEDILREIMGHEKSDVPNLYQAKYKPKDRDAAHLEIIS